MSHSSRRDFLGHAGLGLGAAALTGLGLPLNAAWAAELDDPQAPKQPHFPAKAKSVIWLHMAGAPSTLDLFDYKPELINLAGKPLPDSFAKGLKTATDGGVGNLLATKRTWKQYGETGAWVSDFLPNLAKQVDDIAFLKGCKTEGATHIISSLKLHTAGLVPGRPASRRPRMTGPDQQETSSWACLRGAACRAAVGRGWVASRRYLCS